MYDDFFRGKVALVTGAATGMGRSTALLFAQAGAKVVLADVADEAGEKTLADIRAAGGDARYLHVDVSSTADVRNMVDKTVEWFGRLDCAFNNAGIFLEGEKLADCTEEIWDKTIAVDLKGVFLCLKYELPVMVRQGGGAIVNTASVNAMRVLPKSAAYTAAKFGVVGLTRMAAVEYGGSGVRVNAILPGSIMTPMMERGLALDPTRGMERIKATRPLGVAADPIEIAKSCLFLCSDQANHITGHSLAVDGGYVGAA
ncbi:MAG TPA: SDR family oxidoreductase [Stellaceae bacterium]|nr:SDR family oxidoreductase [Stellaceae bacterium]